MVLTTPVVGAKTLLLLDVLNQVHTCVTLFDIRFLLHFGHCFSIVGPQLYSHISYTYFLLSLHTVGEVLMFTNTSFFFS